MKTQEVLRLSKRFKVIVLLETHGTPEQLENLLRSCLKRHRLITHPFVQDGGGNPRSDIGGLAILVERERMGAVPLQLNLQEFCPGRLVMAEFFREGVPHRMSAYCVHNYGINAQQFRAFESYFYLKNASARADPLSKSLVLLGDLNLEPNGVPRVSIPKPDSTCGPELESWGTSLIVPRGGEVA